MSTEITAHTAGPPDPWSRERLELVREQIAPGCTDPELAYFVEVARSSGLDPIRREIYAIKRGGRLTIQAGIDGLRKIAAGTGDYAGQDAATYERCQGWRGGEDVSCTVTVYRLVRGIRVAFHATAYFSEYDGKNPMWQRMPRAMLQKCAEAKALRMAFPSELSGLYAADEMDQAAAVEPPRATAPPGGLRKKWFALCGHLAKFEADADVGRLDQDERRYVQRVVLGFESFSDATAQELSRGAERLDSMSDKALIAAILQARRDRSVGQAIERKGTRPGNASPSS